MTGGQEALLVLADGTSFEGEAIGAPAPGGVTTGEAVFNTVMSGYQEVITDPSYAGQIIAFTYPHIGNYGVARDDDESARPFCRGVIVRELARRPSNWRSTVDLDTWLNVHGVPGITGVDTRALVRHIRDAGAMRGGIFGADVPEREARERVDAEPTMVGRDLARVVTLDRHTVAGEGGELRIAALDTGIKHSIIRNFTSRGARLELLPCTSSAQEVLDRDPDGVFLVPGPGDPAALDYVVDTLRELVGRKPTFGICLGHQLLCRAVGLQTFKLPFGHRGGNHPVKDLQTGRIEITSQNHGFAVLGPRRERTIDGDEPVRWETDFGAAQLSHINLYDRTVEGLTLLDVPGGTVQYHPEAGPGPNDSLYLFDRFLDQIAAHA